MTDAKRLQPDQGDFVSSRPSGKSGIPNISLNRFPRCRELSCFKDSARTDSVKGNASCSLFVTGVPFTDGGGPPGPEVEAEL